jgi:hypothetical protein
MSTILHLLGRCSESSTGQKLVGTGRLPLDRVSGTPGLIYDSTSDLGRPLYMGMVFRTHKSRPREEALPISSL